MPTVLVVDDSLVDRRLVKGILNKETDWQIEEADNGGTALDKLASCEIDVVVTDMQMPILDGLELVQKLRIHYPSIPVILMTGQGSESLAVEALAQGAVSYVPKSKLNDLLPTALGQITGMMSANRSYERLISCTDRNEFTFTLPNDPQLIDPLVDLVQQMLEGMHMSAPIERVRVGVALEQALLNALYRGNLEVTNDLLEQAREQLLLGGADPIEQRRTELPYSARTIYVDVVITRDKCAFVVRDQGPGFDVSALPKPGDSAPLEHEGGRGLVLMNAFMDEVRFNDKGNEVTMLKMRTQHEQDQDNGEPAKDNESRNKEVTE